MLLGSLEGIRTVWQVDKAMQYILGGEGKLLGSMNHQGSTSSLVQVGGVVGNESRKVGGKPYYKRPNMPE